MKQQNDKKTQQNRWMKGN